MKYCPNCGKELPDEAAFCGECGCAMPAAQAEVYAEAAYPEGYAQTYAEGYPEAYPQTYPQAYPEAYPQTYPEYAPEQPPKKKKTWLWVTLGVLAVLIAAAVVGFFTNWFGLVSPLHGLGKAIAKTGSAESLTLKATVKYTYDDGETEKATGNIRLVLDEDEEKIYYITESDGNTVLFDDGDVYTYIEAEDEDDYDYAYVTESDESAGKEYFDRYEDLYDGKDIDWEEWVELAELEDYVNGKKVESFLEEFNKEYLRDAEWLEKTLGFEKEGNTYTFEPSMKRLSKEINEIVEDSRAFTDEAKEAVDEVMTEIKESAEEEDISLRISFTVKGGYVSEITIKATADDAKVEYAIEITDVNKTSITAKERGEIRDKVEQLIDENTCDECGDTLWFQDEDDYHGDCSFCDEHGDLRYTVEDQPACYDCYYTATHSCQKCGDSSAYYNYDGYDRLCYDCYYALKYAYDTCDVCGSEESYLYDYNGYDLCWDCYYDFKYGY